MNNEGYLLIEVLILIVLISILASLAYPNIKLYRSNKDFLARQTLLDDLKNYRNLAMINGNMYKVRFYRLEDEYIINTYIDNKNVRSVKKLPEGMEVLSDCEIDFSSTGVVKKGASLRLRSYKGRLDLVIRPVTSYIYYREDY